MDDLTKNILWSQFGAAMDTLENAIKACPLEVWEDQSTDAFHQYWYMAYHTIFWLDYYLSDNHKEYQPPEPFTMSEFDPEGAFPERIYTQEELLDYLEHCRQKCRRVIGAIYDGWLKLEYDFGKKSLNYGELLLYNLRHVQHHSAQLNMLLRQKCDMGSPWVFRAKDSLQ